jgi:hypothetical protein
MSSFKLVVAGLIFVCSGYTAFAEDAAAPSKDGARLIFVRAEPIEEELQIRDDKVKVVNLKMWFKNEGRSPAQLLSVGISHLVTDKRLEKPEEEHYFLSAIEGSSTKLSGVVEPGQMTSFISQSGAGEQGWADFLAKKKYLYSFISTAYRSEESSAKGDMETETCIWFENGDLNAVNLCKTDRNRVMESER